VTAFNGTKLQMIRSEQGLSSAELAKMIGVKPNIVDSYENGTTNPSVVRLRGLCQALQVETAKLLDITDGHTLKDLRELALLTSSEAAADLGLSTAKLYRLETGKTKVVADVKARMAKVYGVKPQILDEAIQNTTNDTSPVLLEFPDEVLKTLDAKRGDTSRVAYIIAAVEAADPA